MERGECHEARAEVRRNTDFDLCDSEDFLRKRSANMTKE